VRDRQIGEGGLEDRERLARVLPYDRLGARAGERRIDVDEVAGLGSGGEAVEGFRQGLGVGAGLADLLGRWCRRPRSG
jgi:hypothetical protein